MKALEVILMCNTVYAALIKDDTTYTPRLITQSSSYRTVITPAMTKCSAHCNGFQVNDPNCLGCSEKATKKQIGPEDDITTNCSHYQKICLDLCKTTTPKPHTGYTLYPVQYETNKSTCEYECLERWFCLLERYDAVVHARRILGPMMIAVNSDADSLVDSLADDFRNKPPFSAIIITRTNKAEEVISDSNESDEDDDQETDDDDEDNLRRRKPWQSCIDKAAKLCTKACKDAVKDACSFHSCKHKLKKFLKKECKRNCKDRFNGD